jgi:hypothetical protein
MQRYVRATRYLRFARLGWEHVQLDKICRALIEHAGLLSWEEYASRAPGRGRLYFEYTPAHLR